MKIGMVSKFFPETDGIARFSENLCNNINRHEIVKIGDTLSGTKYRADFSSFGLGKRLGKIIDKEDLNVMHVQYIPAYFGKFTLNLNLLKALRQRIPAVCTLHEVYYNYDGYGAFRKPVLSFLEREVVKKAEKIIVHTPGQKKFIEEKYGAK